MALQITDAVRTQRKAKIAIYGISGSGKTYTSLKIARGIVGPKGSILVVDSEQASSAMYSNLTDFKLLSLPDTSYKTYLEAFKMARDYDIVIVDSLSHAWEYLLDYKSKLDLKSKGSSFNSWGKITPIYNKLIQSITHMPNHVIATMRGKKAYVMETNSSGKTAPKKVGTGAVIRDGSEYEFDVVGELDGEHNLIIEKSRIDFLSNDIIEMPGEELGVAIGSWLNEGAPIPQPQPVLEPTLKKEGEGEEPKAKTKTTRERVKEELNTSATVTSIKTSQLNDELVKDLTFAELKQVHLIGKHKDITLATAPEELLVKFYESPKMEGKPLHLAIARYLEFRKEETAKRKADGIIDNNEDDIPGEF